nr:colicin D domain-containing protein [Xenorhabdus cabanillasii]
MAASLAYATLDDIFEDPVAQEAGGKIIGGLAGAFISGTSEGTNSGADAGEITIIYNHLYHALPEEQKEKYRKIQAENLKKACTENPKICKYTQSSLSIIADNIWGISTIKGYAEAEKTGDYLIATAELIPLIKYGKTAFKTAKEVSDALINAINLGKQAAKKGDFETASKIFKHVYKEIKHINSTGSLPDIKIPINAKLDSLVNFSDKQLQKKFKHGEDIGIKVTKPNTEALRQFEKAIRDHVKDSRVLFSNNTNNAVVVDKFGNFVTGFKLKPGTPQYENYMKNGALQ